MTNNYFEMYELSCNCGCGLYNVDAEFYRMLNQARDLAKVPFKINSGCRCEEHNQFVGGRVASAHLTGQAADIQTNSSRDRYYILLGLMMAGFTRIGIYRTFIHADSANHIPGRVIWYGG